MSGEILVGCCGFPGTRRAYYADFPLVELQSTFYQPPSLGTVARWRSEAPPSFQFTVKAWQVITHPHGSPTYRRMRRRPVHDDPAGYGSFQQSPEVQRAWRQVQAVSAALRAPAILFQCPPSFHCSEDTTARLRAFMRQARAGAAEGPVFVWEPRGDWDEGLVRDLCQELGVTHCVDPLVASPAAGDIAYFRLHGGAHYRHRYSDAELAHLRDICHEQLAAGRSPVYVLFNNMAMADDARRFQRLLAG